MAEISQQDVKALYDDSSPQRRSVLAMKIGHEIQDGSLSESEQDLAIAICQKLAEDVETTVRQSLSQALKKATEIPHDLALKLAQDVLDVSLPILEFNTLLSDHELMEIVEQGESERQLAISKRAHMSPALSHSLCSHGDEAVVDSVLQNDGAEIADNTYDLVLDRFEQSQAIHASLATRQQLPPHVLDRLVDVISDQLKAHLLTHQNLSPLLTERVILESREDAKRRLLRNPLSKRDAEKLVITLDNKGKLTPELIFRALEVGDRPFFEFAMARRVGIDVQAARTLIKDPGEKGFAALYKKAKLPARDFTAINYLVDVEYRTHSHRPITTPGASTHARQEPETWLTETQPKKKKWRLF